MADFTVLLLLGPVRSSEPQEHKSGCANCHCVMDVVSMTETPRLWSGKANVVHQQVLICLARMALQFPLVRIVSVACGGNHTLAITEHGALWSCGRNRRGQLGIGTVEDTTQLCRAKGQLE